VSYTVTVGGASYPIVLPNSSTDLELAIAAVDAWRIGSLDADIIRRVHRPEGCPEPFLPILAWEYSVDEWDPEWTAAVKRQAIEASYDIHRHKGTAYAVELAISALNYGAKVEEWFEYGSTAYRFRLTIELNETEAWTGKRAESLARTALRTKNVRSRLETILVSRTTKGSAPYIGGVLRCRTVARLTPEVPSLISLRPYVFIGGTVRTMMVTVLSPGE
jgi:phage tail P2-like protein